MDELRRIAVGGGTPPPIEPQLPQGDDPGMEACLKRVEDDVRAMRTELTGLTGRLAAVEGKLDVLITQVVAKVTGAWQLLGVILSALVALLAIMAALLRWGGLTAP